MGIDKRRSQKANQHTKLLAITIYTSPIKMLRPHTPSAICASDSVFAGELITNIIIPREKKLTIGKHCYHRYYVQCGTRARPPALAHLVYNLFSKENIFKLFRQKRNQIYCLWSAPPAACALSWKSLRSAPIHFLDAHTL